MLETIPADDSGVDPDRQTRQVDVEAATYEQGREEIFSSLPPGWRVINLRVEGQE